MQLYKPTIPELPKPARDYNFIIIVLLIVSLLLMTGLYIAKSAKSWDIYCEAPKYRLAQNNMQASHAYTGQISNRDTLACIKADDYGELWGSSMQPTFFEGNTVLLKNYTENVTIHTGDIVRFFRITERYPNCTVIQEAIANNSLGGSYVDNDMAVIHRVNAVYDDVITTQGDNLNDFETINRCQITDVAVGIIFT